ncbi:hypothetical protein JXA63_03465 [Candidatus Woesebacteria bacterium]|nr:hypothetical protein [Candidatus Woesebacteria bacterium]
MDTKALQLNCRFALPPNSLGYCGKGSAPERFKKCILGKSCRGVRSEIEKFIVLNPYLETISELIGKDKYDYQVAEAYWLGNKLLKRIKDKDYNTLLKHFEKQGVPPWFVDELRSKKPKKFIPTHLFQVLHVGVGKASGAVPYNMHSINNCMIRWGRVEVIGKDKLKVDLNSLKKNKNKFKLTKHEGNYVYRKEFIPGLKKGDYVVVHWKQVVKKLDNKEIEKLNLWTNEVLSSLY